MLTRTDNYKNELYFIKSHQEKLDFLKDKYKGMNCFIIAPGPSSRVPEIKQILDVLNENLVFCVKPSYEQFYKYCDFHFYNDCNLPHKNGVVGYEYHLRHDPIKIFSSGYDEQQAIQRTMTQNYDIFCKVLDPHVSPNNMGYVLESGKFEEGTFDNSYSRPCGPGLMIETVFYMAVHLGVKNIFTIGVDGGVKFEKVLDKDRENLYLDTSPKTNVELEFKKFEFKMIQEGTLPLCNWLESKGINLFIASDQSVWNKEIPRIKIEDIKDHL
jgi:hypothetical protein